MDARQARPGVRSVVAAVLVLTALFSAGGTAWAEEPAAREVPAAPSAREAEALSASVATRGDSAGDAVDDSLRASMVEETARFDLLGRQRKRFRSWRSRVEQRHGISFGLAYTVLYQHAARGPRPRDAAVGDLDLFGRWRVFGSKDADAGSVHLHTEWRHLLGTEIAPFNLSKGLGTLNQTTTGFTEQPFTVTQLYWEQNWGRGRWKVRIGKLDPAAFLFGNRINNANTYFVGFPFSDNPAVFFPGAALGANLTWRLDEAWSATVAVHDANGKKLGDPIATIEEGELWWGAQIAHEGCTPRLGVGHVRVGGWYVEAREASQKPGGGGFVLSVDQELGRPGAVGFLRYEYQTDPLETARQGVGAARQGLVPARQSLRLGAAVEGLIPRGSWREDVFGLAVAWTQPYRDPLRDEFQVEAFWRFQLGPNMQLTPSYQLYVSPAGSPALSTVSVFSVRFRLTL